MVHNKYENHLQEKVFWILLGNTDLNMIGRQAYRSNFILDSECTHKFQRKLMSNLFSVSEGNISAES